MTKIDSAQKSLITLPTEIVQNIIGFLQSMEPVADSKTLQAQTGSAALPLTCQFLRQNTKDYNRLFCVKHIQSKDPYLYNLDLERLIRHPVL